MIKDIVVVLDGVGTAACPYACSLASRLDAILLGACVPLAAEAVAAAGWLSLRDMDQDLREEMDRRSAAAERVLKAAGLLWEVPTAMTIVGTETLDARARLAGLLRLHDLVILEQPDASRFRPADGFFDVGLMMSGRPCLMVPHQHAGTASLDVVMIAWDGSAASARAIGDALPLLARAGLVEVVHVSHGEPAEDRHAEAELLGHLARHGIDALYHDFRSRDSDGQALLAHAADVGADLVVMGAYHHSPLREALLDGVTRSVVRSATMPVLMSH